MESRDVRYVAAALRGAAGVWRARQMDGGGGRGELRRLDALLQSVLAPQRRLGKSFPSERDIQQFERNMITNVLDLHG